MPASFDRRRGFGGDALHGASPRGPFAFRNARAVLAFGRRNLPPRAGGVGLLFAMGGVFGVSVALGLPTAPSRATPIPHAVPRPAPTAASPLESIPVVSSSSPPSFAPFALDAAARTPLVVAQDALKRLDDLATRGLPLTPADQPWLSELEQAVGRASMNVPDPDRPGSQKVLDCRLVVDRLEADPSQKELLRRSLRAVVHATTAPSATTVALGAGTLSFANPMLASRTHPRWSPHEVESLLALLHQHGTFNEGVDPRSGLVATTSLEPGENPGMERQWVTDTVRCGDLQRDAHPETWPLALQTLAAFYARPSERAAFDRAIAHPDTYRNGPPLEGVAHIFLPSSLERDTSWFNNKRLESHGLALQAFCETFLAGLVEAKPWGFREDHLDPSAYQNLVEAISNLAAYLMAIDYANAPSAGPWEETPFAGGLSWDIEAVRAGLEALRRLAFDAPGASQGNPAVNRLRKALFHTRHGARWGTPTLLDGAIDAGHKALVSRLAGPQDPMEHPLRPWDASLAFITGSTVRLGVTPLEDARHHLRILGVVEKHLVRNHGVLRYAPFKVPLRDGSQALSPDSYLSKNYWIAFDRDNRLNLPWQGLLAQFGSKDASEEAVFLERARFATPHTEAEWFMVSDMAYGYGRQFQKLTEAWEGSATPPPEAERELARFALAKEVEYVQRSLARVTPPDEGGSRTVKSNGHGAQGWRVPEAYEYVTTLDPTRPQRAVVGAHVPLAWARSSLYRALHQLRTDLIRAERWPSLSF